jgi:hypothetical protein
MKTTWTSALIWLLTLGAALVLAWVAPNERRVMGHVPAVTARTLDQQSISLPDGLPAERTLALIAFRATHREQVDSWIQGLNLNNDTSIVWLRMPVLNDPGSAAGRAAVETRLLRRHPSAAERARLVPVFIDRDYFVRSAGLNGTDQVYAVVLNRKGEVLARAEGMFDTNKAENLRETLAGKEF